MIYYAIDKMWANEYLKMAMIIILSVVGFALTQRELVFPISLDWSLYDLLYYATGNRI